MANEPLSALAAQLQADQSKADGILLGSQYLTPLIGGIGLPAGLDQNLALAFQTGGTGGLQIVLTQAVIGPVSDSGFNVSNVALPVLGGQATSATLTFGLTTAGAGQQLTLQIVTPVPGWSWTDLSPAAAGWPFTVAPVANVTFTFDTRLPGAVQAFSGQLAPPQFFAAVVELVLDFPPGSLPVAGTLDFSKTDGQNVLFPTGVLTAPLGGGPGLKLFHLAVANPAFTLTFPAPDADNDQAPLLGFQLDLSITNKGVPIAGYQLTASVLPPPATLGTGAPPSAPTSFSFLLSNGPDSAILTPATLMELAGGASYFAAVPPAFQQFLTLVGLRGLSLSGTIDPLAIRQVGAAIGANPATLPWTLFSDGTNDLTLAIDDLEMNWQVVDPLGDVHQSVTFSTELTFLPKIFQGTFAFEISSDLEFDARFDGTATLQDMVYYGSGTLISLPPSIQAAMSDVRFHYSHSSGAYSFAAGVSADLGFVTIGGKDLFTMNGASIGFSAKPPQAGGGNAVKAGEDGPKTIYHASFGGVVSIGPVSAMTSIVYDSASGWLLSAAATAPIDLGTLIEEVFTLGGQYTFPDFLKPDVDINALAVTASIPASSTEASSYTVSGAFTWNFTLAGYPVSELQAQLQLAYDGANFSGSGSASLHIDLINTTVDLAYAFDRANDNMKLAVTWEGVTATYTSGDDQLVFTFAGCTIGSIVTALVRTVGNPYFALTGPWALLDKIPLDGLKVAFELGADAQTPISATYTLPSPLELGFATINGVTLNRMKAGNVTLQLDGDSPLLHIGTPDPKLLRLFGRDSNALPAAEGEAGGQDVTDLPDIPGQGNEYFKLPLFTMGQRVAIAGMGSEPDVKSLIADMSNVPSTDGDSNPVVAAGGNPPKGTPYYDRSSDWLIAAHMLVLKAGNDWTVDLSFVFHDSDLYGLHLEMAGEKAKALAGLEIDILYKKVTDEIGMYQIDWRFPDYVRNLNFGAVSVVLPDIGVRIYTNGDFLIDIGFPYNMDFSRSCAFSVIIAGVPVTGGGGVYFGKLSGATSTFTPTTTLGTFNPVIVFGVGFQVGLGYSFTAGPLSAGFSLTVFAIIEGVIAPWHPYQTPAATGGSVQRDYYFKVSGTAGIIGILYGSIDFAIIKASLLVNLTLSLSLTYESFQPIDIEASASVTVSVKVSIDLGLFSISFHLSFHAEAHASFVIHVDDGTPPWIASSGDSALQRPAAFVDLLPAPLMRGQAKPVLRTDAAAAADPLNLYATVAYTILAAEGETDPKQQTGAFVTLLMLDATSFQTLCQDLLPYLVDHLAGHQGEGADLAAAGAATVTPDRLQAYMDLLANLGDPPLGFGDYLTFLSSFAVNLQALTQQNSGQLDQGSVPFPPFDGLIATPVLDGTNGTAIDFSTYAIVEPGYREGIANLFEALTAELEKAGAPAPTVTLAQRAPPPPESPESMAAMLFTDMMMMTGRQLLQAAKNAFRNFQLALTAQNNNIAAILAWSQSTGTADGSGISVDDIVLPNASTPLAGGTFTIPAPPYTIRNGDTLDGIAKPFGIGAADLIAGNPDARVIAAGLAIPAGNPNYVTPAAISFAELCQALGTVDGQGPWTPAQLAAAIGDAQSLVAGQGLALRVQPGDAGLVIAVAADDTLAALAARYGTTVSAIGAVAANQSVSPLFDSAKAPSIPLDHVGQAAVSDLWALILANGRVPDIAGMVSRFMTAGLRLPVSTDKGALTLSDAFNANNPSQSRYGLYQLTGQQFPAAPASPAPTSYQIVVSRPSGTLPFITFDNGDSSSVDLLGPTGKPGPADMLAELLTAAQQGPFNPETSFRIFPAAARTATAFALSAGVGFVSADPKAIATLTGAPADQSVRQPMLWMLPASLLDDAAARQLALDAAGLATSAQLPYLQALQPEALGVDPATKAPIQTPLGQYAWATRIEFSVKRLPPPPAGATPSKTRAFTYELLALDAAQASLLGRLVAALAQNFTDQPISGLFLAYPQGSGTSAQLMAPADPSAPAFFSRTNLSTEAHPELAAEAADNPPPAPPPPIGNVANPAAQTVTLLWELSTVRSGGYFLSWDQLPDSAFDSTGKAELALLVAYPMGGPLTQDRLTAFVNALLTDDPAAGAGVQVAVESQAAPTTAQPASGASLAGIGALYGLSPGRVAELNATFPLVPNVTVPVGGITHLVTAAEAASGNPWETIAGEYPPLAGNDIQAVNPNVTPAAGTALYIPTVPYLTATGDTLMGVAGRYGISLDDLATSAAAAPILTSPSETGTPIDLAIDPQALDVRPGDASGNVTFELNRPAPSSTLEQLYTMLAAGVQSNRFFNGSAGTPIGPQQHDDPMDPGAAKRAAARRRALADPDRRRVMLAAMAEDDTALCYRQALGLLGVATSNVAPAGGTDGAPDGADNPYKGVGTLAQLDLEWRDLFGNILVDQFGAPPTDYGGPVAGQIVPLLYRDKLIGPAAWPNLGMDYLYTDGGLQITPALSTKAYEGNGEAATVKRRVAGTLQDVPAWQAAAQRDWELYCRVWYQLNQDYSSAGLPWADGQAVRFSLHNGLLAEPELALSDDQAATFRTFVAQALAYLDQRRQGNDAPAPTVPPLVLPIDVDQQMAAGEILPLALTLTLSRPGLLVDSALAGLADAEVASIDLLPTPDDINSAASGYSSFAQAFEKMFVSARDGWTMRVGTSHSTGAAGGGDKRTQSLWAMRFADTPLGASPNGLGFTLDALPLFYAPLPLATSLVSDSFQLYPAYDGTPWPPTGGTVSQAFTGVDPNVWFQSVLDAIDNSLAPDLAAALYLFDLSQGSTDPLTSGALAELLTAKQSLAADIASTMNAILEPAGEASAWPTPDEDSRKSATDVLQQALLNRLGPAFATTAVTVFAASQVAGPDAGAGGPVKLYGKPSATLVGDETQVNSTFALSSTRLPLDPNAPARLAFLLDSRNLATGASYLPLTLDWNITHVERRIGTGPEIEGYAESDWIGFITPTAPVPFNPQGSAAGTIDVPVLLRALPQPPTMHGQSAKASHPDAVDPKTGEQLPPAALAMWDYRVDFSYDRPAWDSVETEIDLNLASVSQNGQSQPISPEASALYQALAQFVQVYPAVSTAMGAALGAIGGGNGGAAAAKIPVGWFTAIVGNVASAYHAWAHPPQPHAFDTALPPEVQVNFEIELVPAEDSEPAIVALNGITINGAQAAVDPNALQISAGGITLPLPIVQIDPTDWTAGIVTEPDPGAGNARFQYTNGSGAILTHGQAAAINARSIVMPALNIFGYRNASTTLSINRNEHLLPEDAPPASTNPAFIFSTPDVQFASPAAASLVFPGFILDALAAPTASYASYLDTFFTELAAGTTGTAVEAAATVTYAHSLMPDPALAQPRTVVPVALLLHTPDQLSPTQPPAFVAPLAAMTDQWRTDNRPTVTGDGPSAPTIDLALAIYPQGDGDLQPMLRIDSVTLTAAKAPPGQ